METTFADLAVGSEFKFFGEIEPSPNYSEFHKGVKIKSSRVTYKFNGIEYNLKPQSLETKVVGY